MMSSKTMTRGSGPFGPLGAERSEIATTVGRRRLWGTTRNSKRKNRRRFNLNKLMLQNNVVLNFSKYKLSIYETSVLNKGLGFVPTAFKPSKDDICRDVVRFERRLQLHYFFDSKQGTDDPDRSKKTFERNPDWWPKALNAHITKLCSGVKYLLFDCLKFRNKANLNRKEMAALRGLKNNRQIIIKKCDKGGGIAVLDNVDYLSKVESMLLDIRTYTRVDIDDTLEVKLKADELVKKLGTEGHLNAKQVTYLINFIPRCPIFYGLPKVHKKDIPLRPIVSQIDGPTSRINEYVDKLLFVAEKCIPFLLQDTTAYLQLINRHKVCNAGTFLVTMDVTSLYTNIPHDEGAEWVSEFYHETLDKWNDFDIGIQPIDREKLKELILFILHNCTFEFNRERFRQNYGTTMGARFSVKFANIYMYMWFRKILARYNGLKPPFIARLIDDCFFTWCHTENDLLLLEQFLNSSHVSIKFEVLYSQDRVTFLDTVTYISDGSIKTTIYTKPTDKKQYLFFSSCHPSHVKRSLPYSQAIRYRRIIEDDTLFLTELEDLKCKFVNRGYPLSLLHEQIDKASNLDRQEVLRYKTYGEKRANFEKFLKGKSFLPLIVTYHGGFCSGSFKRKFAELWNTFCASDSDIKAVFDDERPQLVFKRGKTIGNVVISTRFKAVLDNMDVENIQILASLLNDNAIVGSFCVYKCNRPRCLCCSHIIVGSSFSASNSKSVHYVDRDYDCCSSNILYLITCRRCKAQYVGQTSQQLKDRLNNHRSDIRLHKDTAIGIHFNEPVHEIADLCIMPIRDVSDIPVIERYKIENCYMELLRTKYPYGLNFYPIAVTDEV